MTTNMQPPDNGTIGTDDAMPTFGEEKQRQNRRRMVRLAAYAGVGLVTIAILILLLAGGEDEPAVVVRPEDTPLIRAPETPYKTAPDSPGGMDVPHRDKLVYDRLERVTRAPGVERLLPPPEQPLTPPQPSADAGGSAGADLPPGLPPLPTREIPDRPGVPMTPPAAAPQPAAETVAATPFRATPARPRRAEPAAAVRPAPAPPAPQPTPAPSPTGGLYRIQLIAVSSQEQASAAWDQLRRRNPGVLGNLTPVVSRVDLQGGQVLHRLRAGDFATPEAAQAACAQLRARDVDCVTVRPGG